MLATDISDQKQSQAKSEVVDTSAYDAARMKKLNAYASSNNMAALRLEICFAPEMTITVGDVDYIAEPVLSNTSHLLQQKLAQQGLIKTTPTPTLLDVLNSYDASKPLQVMPATADRIRRRS